MIEIYTDGGCHGNPGPGGWAFVCLVEGQTKEAAGNEKATTNNRMELTAVIRALEFAAGLGPVGQSIRLFTDSQYVRQGISSWIKTWMRNGWKTASKDPVKNQDLWVTLNDLAGRFKIDWQWVRGHAGNPLNERCDALVQGAIAAIGG